MNIKTTIILLVFLALGGVAVVLTSGTGDKNREDERQATGTDDRPILDADQLGPSLRRITFDFGEDGVRLELDKRSGRWWVTTPLEFPADSQMIDSLLNLLGNLQGKPTENAPALNPDSPRVILGYTDRETRIAFGRRLGAGRAELTVSHGKQRDRFNAESALSELIERLNPNVFISMAIDVPLMAETGRVSITADGSISHLVQDQNGWLIEKDDTTQRALDALTGQYPGVATYFGIFGEAEIVEHRSYSPQQGLEAFGLDKPLVSVRFVPIEPEPNDQAGEWVLRVGVPADPADQTRFVSYGRGNDPRPAVFTLPTPYALAFGQDATAFRDPRIITTPPTLIESIKVADQDRAQPDRPTTPAAIKPTDRLNTLLIRFTTDGKAQLSWPNDPSRDNRWTEFPPERGAALLQALTNAMAIEFVTEGVQALKPIKSVRITARLDRPTEHFTIYTDPESSEDKPTVFIRRAQEQVALRVHRAAVEALLDPSLLLKDD